MDEISRTTDINRNSDNRYQSPSSDLHDSVIIGGNANDAINLIPQNLNIEKTEKIKEPRKPLDIEDTYFGVEIEMGDFYNLDKLKEQINRLISEKKLSDGWVVTDDSSIKNTKYNRETAEIKSPKLKIKKGGLDELRTIYRVIAEHEGKANPSCGLHFHVDTSELNHKDIINLLKIELQSENVLYQLAKGHDKEHRGGRQCEPISHYGSMLTSAIHSSSIEDLKGVISRYYSINIKSFWKHGTIELRINNATDDPDIAIFHLENYLRMVKSAHDNEEIPMKLIDKAEFKESGLIENPKFIEKPIYEEVLEHYLDIVAGKGPFRERILKTLLTDCKASITKDEMPVKKYIKKAEKLEGSCGYKFFDGVNNSINAVEAVEGLDKDIISQKQLKIETSTGDKYIISSFDNLKDFLDNKYLDDIKKMMQKGYKINLLDNKENTCKEINISSEDDLREVLLSLLSKEASRSMLLTLLEENVSIPIANKEKFLEFIQTGGNANSKLLDFIVKSGIKLGVNKDKQNFPLNKAESVYLAYTQNALRCLSVPILSCFFKI